MKVCIAQIRPKKGDVLANIEKHKMFVALASSLNANSIFFSELSLKGYEPELAKVLAIDKDDSQLNDFQVLSDHHKITIGLGAPTKSKTGIQISMIVFQPYLSRQSYSKQQLHADELPFFVAGNHQLVLNILNTKVGLAICFESLQPSHSENINKLGTDIYMASVAKSENGIKKALIHYPEVARKYAMPVFMSNCVGFCDNFESVGSSAIWSKEGNIIRKLDDKNEGILIFDTETLAVTTQII